MASITKENLKLMTALIRANLQAAIAKVEDPVTPEKESALTEIERAVAASDRALREIIGQRRETFDDGVTVTGPES